MKHLLFSLICIASLCISTSVQAVETATPDELLDYIKNPPPITSKDDWNKPTSPEMEAFLEKLAGTNQDQPESQMKQDETAAEFIKRRNLENLLLELYGEDKLPDPTISTTQNPPNNGEPPRPSLNDSPKPVITDPSTWMKPTPSVPAIKTPTNVTVLDQIVPLKEIGIIRDAGINGQPLNNIINQLFYIGLIAAVILAIVMIIRGGLEYMTIDAITSKENGKNRVKAALGGLLLAFSAILILNTINPGLTKLNLKFDQLKLITSTTIFGGLTSGTRPSTWTGEPMVGKVGSGFTDKDLEAYTLQKIKEMGFSQLSPMDKAAFFPNGGTDEEWLALVSGMIQEESGWDTTEQYAQAHGLLQLNAEAMKGYVKYNPNLAGITNEDLYDPYKNIEAGLTVLKRLVERDGYISGPNFKGAADYWAVLREEDQWNLGKLNKVKNFMKEKGE